MSLARHRTDIETLVMDEMVLVRPGLVMIGENSGAQPPRGEIWMRMSFTVLDAYRPCINTPEERTEGIFNVQIFAPLAGGAGDASTLVDEVRTVLRNSNLTGIEFLEYSVATGQVEGDWYILLLRANYRAQD